MATNKDEGTADEVVDQSLAGRDRSSVFASDGLIDELKKRLAERMLNAELDHHPTGTAWRKKPATTAMATVRRPSSQTAASSSFRFRAIWRRNWEQVIPFFAFAPELRKIIYTTNAIESLNAEVRKAVRIRGHFPSEEAATKLIWPVLRKVQTRWKNPPIFWQAAKAQLANQFEDRVVVAD